MPAQLTLDLFAPPNQGDPDWKNLSIQELQEFAFFPKGGIPDNANKSNRIRLWMEANHEVARRIQAQERTAFAAKGTAQQWWLNWTPKSKVLQELSDAIEEALHIIESHYPKILARGLNHPEDLGILYAKGRGSSEGVSVKKAPYQEDLIHFQIVCVTGPTNFDPSTQSIQFEPGAKSHIFHLAYLALPSLQDLEADLCVYPIIRDPSNWLGNDRRNTIYRSEGFTGRLAKTGVPAHRPWNSLTPKEQSHLIQTASPDIP